MNNTDSSEDIQAISIVVCCKNEISNIHKLVESLLLQKYDTYEIIFVDDFSTDGTFEFLNSIKNEKISVYQFAKKSLGKKELLQYGISQSINDWILVCDADCIPASSHWIKEMAQALHLDKIEIVLGYAPFYESKSILNSLSRYENFMTGIFYLSMALAQRTYMGVGRNMLFSKKLYENTIQKVLEIDTISGDDDLFINKASNRVNTTICIEPGSFVYSNTKNRLRDFFNQKKRHISTGYFYNIEQIIILSLYPISNFTMLISYVAILFFLKKVLLVSTMLLFAYFTTSMLIKTYCAEKLNFRSVYPVFFLDMLYLCYQIILHPLYLIKKNKQW